MYADDTHLTYAGACMDNLQLYLNQNLNNFHNWLRANKLTLNNFHNWLRANKLTLNMTKTEFMLIGLRQTLSTLIDSPTITINDNQVSLVTTAKSLGVTIDNKLNWSGHSIDKQRRSLLALGL